MFGRDGCPLPGEPKMVTKNGNEKVGDFEKGVCGREPSQGIHHSHRKVKSEKT